jgi:hypothetical protein
MKHPLFLAAVAIICSSRLADAAAPDCAVIKSTRGVVEKYSNGEWSAVHRGEIILAGERVRTGNKGFTEITFIDRGGTIGLNRAGAVTLDATVAFGGLSKSVTLEYGSAIFDIPENLSRVFEVLTPSTIISVKGTTFLVSVSRDAGQTAVYGIEGLVAVLDHATGTWQELQPSHKAEATTEGVTIQKLSEQDKQLIERAAATIGAGRTATYESSVPVTITIEGSGTVEPGTFFEMADSTTRDIRALADSGAHFVAWRLNGGNAIIDDAEAFETDLFARTDGGDISLSALFSTTACSLSVTIEGEGRVSPANTIAAWVDVPVRLSATPSTDHHFVGWSVHEGHALIEEPLAPEATIIPRSPRLALTARFSRLTGTLTVTGTDGVEATPSVTDSTVPRGVPIAIACTPRPGHSFYGWELVEGDAAITNAATTSSSVILHGESCAIRAQAIRDAVTIAVNETPLGGIEPATLFHRLPGDTIRVHVRPRTGYTVTAWQLLEGDAELVEAGDTVRIVAANTSATIAPLIERKRCRVEVHAGPGGTASAAGGTEVCLYGESFAIRAEPLPNHTFDSWEITGGKGRIEDPANWYSAATALSDQVIITARFMKELCTLTVASTPHGTTNPAGDVTVPVDSALTLEVSDSAPGYRFVAWKSLSGRSSIAEPRVAATTVRLHSSTATISPVFTNTRYTVTVAPPRGRPGGRVTGAPSEPVDSGMTVYLHADPDEGAYFSSWEVTDGSLELSGRYRPDIAFDVTGDVTLRPVFGPLRTVAIGAYPRELEDHGSSGLIRPRADLSAADGTECKLSALNSVRLDNGCRYRFERWELVSGTADIASPTSRVTTVRPSSDIHITARYRKTGITFSALWDPSLASTVHIDNSGERHTGTDGMIVRELCGKRARVTIVPDEGRFVRWRLVRGRASIVSADSPEAMVYCYDKTVRIHADLAREPVTLRTRTTLEGNLTERTAMPDEWQPLHVAERRTAEGDFLIDGAYYRFAGWKSTNAEAVIRAPSHPYTRVKLGSGSATIEAMFEKVTYSLKTAVTGCEGECSISIDKTSGIAFSLEKGRWYTVDIDVPEGLSFSRWRGSEQLMLTAPSAPARIMATGDGALLTAFVSDKTYRLSYTTDGDGSIQPSSPLECVDGRAYTLTPLTDDDHYFERWEVVSGEVSIREQSGDRYSVAITGGDASITGHFLPKPGLRVEAEGATVRPSGVLRETPGEWFTVTATPLAGHYFEKWMVVEGDEHLSLSPHADPTRIGVRLAGTGDAGLRAVCPALKTITAVASYNGIEEPGALTTIRGEPGRSYRLRTDPVIVRGDKRFSFRRWSVVDGNARINYAATRPDNFVVCGEGEAKVVAVYESTERDITIEFYDTMNRRKTVTIQYR